MCVYLSSLNELKYNVEILKKLACSWIEREIGIDGGSVNYEKDCMCNAMYSACI